MTACEYYYGVDFHAWENLPYFEAIEMRRNLAKDLYLELYQIQERTPKELPFEFRKRLWKVKKAWDDNQKLLDERSLVF
jgi:hypothetical protein